MSRKPLILIILGLLIAAAGGVMSLTGGPAKADPAIVAECRQRVKDQGADALAKCQEANFATAMTAHDAETAARAISAINNNEVGGNAVAMFLLGFGAILAIGGVIAARGQRRRDAV